LRFGVGLGLGDGLLLLLGLGEGLLLGTGVLLLGVGLVPGDGPLVLLLGLVLGEGLLLGALVLLIGLGFGAGLVLLEAAAAGVRLGLLADVGELLRPDTDATSAIPLCGLAFSAEATVVAAGRVAHRFFAARAGAARVPASSTLTSPHKSTAVPASAPNLADPACRFLTVSASPWSMS